MGKYQPLSAVQNQYQSLGDFRLRNIGPNGKTLNPRESGEEIEIKHISTLPRNTETEREAHQILSLDPEKKEKSNKIENPFFEIFKRIDEVFKKDPLKHKLELKDLTKAFIMSLKYRVIDKPDGSGQYITGIPTQGTYDQTNIDQSRIMEILDVLNNHLQITQILDDNFGTFKRDSKNMVTAGQLILNFTNIAGKSLLEHVTENRKELAAYLNHSNAFGAFYNGDINKNAVFTHNKPVSESDEFMQYWGPIFDQQLETYSDGTHGDSNFTYETLDLHVPVITPGTKIKTLPDALATMDHSVPGFVTTRLANAVDKEGLRFNAEEQEIIIDKSKLGNTEADNLMGDISRRVNGGYIDVNFSDKVDQLNRKELESIAKDQSA
jgi:hypothetical protein